MDRTISFQSKYKGKFKDLFLIQLQKFIFTFALSVICFVIVTYICFTSLYRIQTLEMRYLLMALFYILPLIALFSPFLMLLVRINKDYEGEVRITFHRREDGQYDIHLTGTRKKKEYQINDIVNTITFSQSLVKVTTLNQYNEIYIPLKAIQENDRIYLLSLNDEVTKYRIEETKRKTAK